jgi:catechol 2,3-dioxygenase-like lactoylglutathione lyase family enzyme
MDARALDHIALWVADRDALADFVCAHAGMHVIDRTDAFTLVGSDARRGKLTLFAAEGPRDPGPLERVVLRVSDLERAAAALPAGLDPAAFEAPEGLGLGLVEVPATDVEYDIDHVVLRVPDPARAVGSLAALGLHPDGDGRLVVGDKHVRLMAGASAPAERPLLNHIALLVDSGQEQLDAARAQGIEIAEIRDGANTFAFFVWGPDQIQLEYVEHKPEFSLT